MMRSQQHQYQRDQQSRVFYELSALVLSLLRSQPMPVPFPDQSLETPNPPARRRLLRSTASSSMTQISPSGFASLLLGISVALMLCGSVTFFLGFLLMPWVIGLIMVFYVAGIVSAISMVGRSILCYALAPPSSSGKDIPEWKLL